MSIIDHSSIKRVSLDDGLESITLRSDLAARYTFLNETLLEGVGAVSVDNTFRSMLNLKEVITDDDNRVIVDEVEYLKQWQSRLQEEVSLLEQQAASSTASSTTASATTDTTTETLRRLDAPLDHHIDHTDSDDVVLSKFDAFCATHQPRHSS